MAAVIAALVGALTLAGIVYDIARLITRRAPAPATGPPAWTARGTGGGGAVAGGPTP
ncbi:hypothetical protein ACIBU0_33455 [Streptomyces sp. NPDC049627]|uniref:hypothetical protein n=1 Tax=Streptomyces sp. NPDC049627 TaxID=3365595 RepID=UPI003791F06E